MREALVMLVVGSVACRPEPPPNAAGLIVSGKLGVPVFEWTGEEQEQLGIYDEGGSPVLELVAAGDPPECVNGMQSPVRWGQWPLGFEEASYQGYTPAGPVVNAGKGYTAWVSQCVGTGTYETSTVLFDVEADGSIRMDCKASLCP